LRLFPATCDSVFDFPTFMRMVPSTMQVHGDVVLSSLRTFFKAPHAVPHEAFLIFAVGLPLVRVFFPPAFGLVPPCFAARRAHQPFDSERAAVFQPSLRSPEVRTKDRRPFHPKYPLLLVCKCFIVGPCCARSRIVPS